MYEYSAEVLTVYDGDTVRLRIDQGFNSSTTQSIRIAGIKCPETVGEDAVQGLSVRDAMAMHLMLSAPGACDTEIRTLGNGRKVIDFVGSMPVVKVRSYKGKRSFARWVGKVTDARGTDLAEWLLDNGHARVSENASPRSV